MATGTSPNVSTPAFHTDDPEQATGYRTLSLLAIIGLVFGIASPLALGGPLLKGIPLFGIALSLLALRRIAVSGGALAGRWAATGGLVLCVVFAVAPFSRDAVARWIRMSQAKEFSQSWIELLTSGKTEDAFHLTVEGKRPPPKPEPGAPAPKTTPYQDFLDQPFVKQLRSGGANPKIHYEATESYEPRTYRNVSVQQRFSVTSRSGNNSAADREPVNVVLTVERFQLGSQGMSHWLLVRGEPVKSTE